MCQVSSESAPHFNIGLCGRGFELSWRRKKKAIGTCHNSIYEWDPPSDKVGTPQNSSHYLVVGRGEGFLICDSINEALDHVHFPIIEMPYKSWIPPPKHPKP